METVIDIETEVYRKYPILMEEAGCRTKRDHRNGLRHAYRLRLIQLEREKAAASNIQSITLPPNEEVGGNVL